nr:hypothetical protein [Deltaproteobacteria bacterium]
MKHTAIFLSLFFAILALTGLSCGLLDSEKIAGNLEDRLTNALDFDS